MDVERRVEKANESGQVFSKILEASEKMYEPVNSALSTTQQIQQFSRERVHATPAVSAVVEEKTVAAEEMSANATDVMQAIESIANISEENSTSTEEMRFRKNRRLSPLNPWLN